MTAAVLPFVVTAFVLALGFALWRLVRGPDYPDRILALDTMYVSSLALLVLFGLMLDTELFFEAALVIALLGFIGTVAMSKFLLRGDVIEAE
jgi:multicomponent K+:H+ antiporter subunit F